MIHQATGVYSGWTATVRQGIAENRAQEARIKRAAIKTSIYNQMVQKLKKFWLEMQIF